jgi:hypothetical protein
LRAAAGLRSPFYNRKCCREENCLTPLDEITVWTVVVETWAGKIGAMFGWVPAASPLCRGHPAPQGVEINTWSVEKTSPARKISPLFTGMPAGIVAAKAGGA